MLKYSTIIVKYVKAETNKYYYYYYRHRNCNLNIIILSQKKIEIKIADQSKLP